MALIKGGPCILTPIVHAAAFSRGMNYFFCAILIYIIVAIDNALSFVVC
jgi:hypothetical protein